MGVGGGVQMYLSIPILGHLTVKCTANLQTAGEKFPNCEDLIKIHPFFVKGRGF